ncbi:MAG: DUF3078 domain-containing protein [Candidatus Azobacteroides sp.]|nr:DUF3078 domain-containing protein [Candidatus Azobacteroides sp.]
MKRTFALLLSITGFTGLHAQQKLSQPVNPDSLFFDKKEYYLRFYYDTLKYNPLFMPLVFDGKWLPDTLSLAQKPKAAAILPVPETSFRSLYTDSSDRKSQDFRNFIHQSAKNYMYAKYPQSVKYNRSMLPEKVPEQKKIKPNTLKDLFTPEPDVRLSVDNIQRAVPKEVFWWKTINSTLNFTQNYISPNWYKGGESNNSLLNIQNIKFGYNDKKKIQFETEIECKFSFYSSPNDTIRSLRVSDDATFLKSKLGYKAVENFYYTFSTEFRTQLFNNYKANSRERISSILSPANLYVSLGMDYKVKSKKVTLSVILSPISYRLIHVKDPEVNPVNFGVDAGKTTKSTFGSMLTSDMTWSFNKQINWVSRLYYYTTYNKVEAEWENTFNFILNRYLATKFIVHSRFDDSVSRNNDLGYYQLRELLSFGLSYKW